MEDWEDSDRCCKYFCRAERALSTGTDPLCCSPAKADTARAQRQFARRTLGLSWSFIKENTRGGPKTCPHCPKCAGGCFPGAVLAAQPDDSPIEPWITAACFPLLINRGTLEQNSLSLLCSGDPGCLSLKFYGSLLQLLLEQ